MGIVNDQSVFIGPPLGEGDSRTLTSFRDNDDFSVDVFDESITLPSFPDNVGVAFVNSSDSPADYATIALRGTNTSTIYVENTANAASFAVSNNVYVGYKSSPSGPSNVGVSGNLYVNGFIYGQFTDLRLRGTTRFGLNTIEISETDNSIIGVGTITASVGIITSISNINSITGSSLVVSGISSIVGSSLQISGISSIVGDSLVVSGISSIVGNDVTISGITTVTPNNKLNVNGNLTVSGVSTVGIASTSNLTSNSTFTFELTNDTTLTIRVRGSDGVVRSGIVTLS